MQATPAMDMRENRPPTRRSAPPSRNRASAMTKHGMPPIQMAAPSWCSASTPSSSALSDSRAAACVVSVAAASSTPPGAQQPARRGAAPQQQRQRARRRGLDHSRHSEICRQHVAHRQVHGGDQHGRLQCHVDHFHAHQRHGTPRGDGGRAPDHGAELGRERPRQQHQEHHAAQRHRLADDHQAMQQDPHIADQVDKAAHPIGCSSRQPHPR